MFLSSITTASSAVWPQALGSFLQEPAFAVQTPVQVCRISSGLGWGISGNFGPSHLHASEPFSRNHASVMQIILPAIFGANCLLSPVLPWVHDATLPQLRLRNGEHDREISPAEDGLADQQGSVHQSTSKTQQPLKTRPYPRHCRNNTPQEFLQQM